ncbi:hypothetical protein PHLCEN_2v8608 [Hermanssonia centrifuga]|uniref:glutathione transferase n=1 Tax=Hermanssonia centrifuga TaxID=98765 RepID=A0A2R6NT60_9APHY|nr:hypothetical protein PHLCEN_2v8608 [Hermanssonia centrifuga]
MSLDSTLIVHHLNDSRSQRILWLLEELEVPYEIKKYQRNADMTAPKELVDVNPLGTAPVITDRGVTLAESGAIVEYIIDKYGGSKALPPDSGKVDNLFFTHYAEGSLMPLLVNKLIFSMIPDRAPFILRPILRGVFNSLDSALINPRLKTQADYIEKHLSKCGDWFAGGQGPTSADYMMSFALEAWANRSLDMLGPKSVEYVKRIQARRWRKAVNTNMQNPLFEPLDLEFK